MTNESIVNNIEYCLNEGQNFKSCDEICINANTKCNECKPGSNLEYEN